MCKMASYMGRSKIVKFYGLYTIANPGMSNKELCKNHNRLMNKVSCTLIINTRLVDT